MARKDKAVDMRKCKYTINLYYVKVTKLTALKIKIVLSWSHSGHHFWYVSRYYQ